MQLNIVEIVRANPVCDVSEMICRCGNQLKARYEYHQLSRYDPRRAAQGKPGLQLDSKKPQFTLNPMKAENRFAALGDLFPQEAQKKYPQLEADLKARYEYYYQMSQPAKKQ